MDYAFLTSNCLTVPLHCWPAAACSLCCFAGYSLNSRPDSAHLILCLVLSTLLHVVDKLEKNVAQIFMGTCKDFQAEEIVRPLAQTQ